MVVSASAAFCGIAVAADQDSYTGALKSQPDSFMGADVFLNGKGVPKKITIGFSLATASCNGQPIFNGQTGGIENARVKKQGRKFTFKGTGMRGRGTSTIEGAISGNGKEITGSVDYSVPLGDITCTFSDSFELKKDKGPKDDGGEND